MTEFTTIPKDCIKICDVGTAEILFCHGTFDRRMVTIKYMKKISGNTAKLIYYSPGDYDIYESYIILNRMFGRYREKWDYLIFDLFKVELDKNFIQNIDKLLEKHNWIKSVFAGDIPLNHFTRVWKTGLENIKGLLVVIRLIGEARDASYYSFENPAEIPISACIGKHGTKDCIYMINQEKYPDFEYKLPNLESSFKVGRYARHFNISELLKIKKVSQNKIAEYIIKSWASKLEEWHEYKIGEDPIDIKLAIEKLAWETIEGTQLSNEDKQKEKDELTKYRIYWF